MSAVQVAATPAFNKVFKTKPIGTKKATKRVVAMAQTYAAQQNARYDVQDSTYVNLPNRFNSTISNLPLMKQSGIRAQLVGACKEFVNKYPHVKKFEDLNLAEAGETRMSDILIDITIQRLLDLSWVIEILKNFREVQADPLKLYVVQDGGDLVKEYPAGTVLFAAWDAQHTAMVYWIIATMITKQDPKDVMVPSITYKVKNKADIRMNFVNGNSKVGKHLLEPIDLFMQMVLGVRVDSSTESKWVEAELKQQYLEQADLFVTHDKFGNTHMPGAISRMAELDKYTSDVIRKFCLYTTAIPTPRAIDSQEIEIMCAWFDMAKNAGIDYTDEQVMELSDYVIQTFGDGWGNEASSFWTKVHVAYKNWHAGYYKSFPANTRPNSRMSKNWNSGGTFLWAQLSKGLPTLALPTLSNSTPFIPDAKDLY